MPSTETPPVPRKRKPTVQELAAEGVRQTFSRPADVPRLDVSPITQPGLRSKLQLDRSTGTIALKDIHPDPDQPRQVNIDSDSFK